MRQYFVGSSLIVLALASQAASAQEAPPPVTAAPLPATAPAGRSAPAVQETAPSVQGTGVAEQQSNSSDAGSGIADIIVTAQRRSESSQRAAIAIDVVSPTKLGNAGIITSSTLNAAVPAIVVAKAGGANTSYFIRGVGNFTVNAYADPAIAFNYDGVYVGRPTSTTGTFFDLDRVEVLKGPQGTLYGRNATGGAINVIPTKPKLGEFSGYGAAGYGNYKALDLEGALNIPLGESFALRAAGKVVHNSGYNKDGTDDEVGQAARLQLYGRLSESLNVRIAGDYSHQGGVGPGASFKGTVNYTPGSPVVPGQIAGYTFVPAPADLGARDGIFSPEAQAYFRTFVIPGAFINPARPIYPSLDNTYFGVNAEVNLTTSIGTLTLIPAYRDSKLRPVFNGPAFYAASTPEHDKQFSSELRLQGNRIGPVDWLIGGYYYDEDISSTNLLDQYQINIYGVLTTGTKSSAAFGRAVVHLSDRFRVVGGGRYTHDSKRLSATSDTLVELCGNAPPPFGPGCFGGPSVPPATSLDNLNAQLVGQLAPAFPGAPGVIVPNGPPVRYGTRGNLLVDKRFSINTSEDFNRFTYKAGLEFDAGPQSLVYLSYETGFRSGGFSVSSSHPVFAPEFIKALTLGAKNRFFNNTLQVNIEAFRWKYTNQQVSHFGFESDGTTNLFTENLGRSTIQGIDLDTQFLATPTTLLRASVQYLDNRIDSFVYTNPFGGTNLPPVTGCRVSPPVNAAATQVYTVDCSGTQGFNSPKWSVNAGFDQTIPFGEYRLILTANGRYRSNRVNGFERLPQQRSGDDTTIDLSATFGPANDQWAITGYVRNLTDVDAPTATQYSGAVGGGVSSNYAPPRTYGVRARVRF